MIGTLAVDGWAVTIDNRILIFIARQQTDARIDIAILSVRLSVLP